MKLKIILTLLLSSSFFITGCGSSSVNVNVENTDGLHNTIFGIDALIYIGDSLYYDSATRIVYFWNNNMYADRAVAPSPYYAPNGLPYKYNPETQTFEEIGVKNNEGALQ